MIEPGAIVGRIRIDRLIGYGGMGAVFAGTHLELEQPVAVKVLRDECVAEPVTVARFLREARAVAKLRTEHVCRVFDVGRFDDGAPYIVMELLAGADLREVMEREPIAPVTAVEYIVQACVAVAEAHAAGIVHRDVKPGNLFLCKGADGRPLVKVLDFGIAKAATAAEAKLTATASMMGTPAYASPEQIRSARDVDARTDVWSLGATLYHLITGRLPFMAARAAEVALKVMHEPPDPIGPIDPGLAAVIARCIEKEPERRYGNASELAAALAPYGGPGIGRYAQLAMPATAVMATPPMQLPSGPSARAKLALGAAVLGIGVLAGVAVVLLRRGGPEVAVAAGEGGPKADVPKPDGVQRPDVPKPDTVQRPDVPKADTVQNVPKADSVQRPNVPNADTARRADVPTPDVPKSDAVHPLDVPKSDASKPRRALPPGTVIVPPPDAETAKVYRDSLATMEQQLRMPNVPAATAETVHAGAARFACMLGDVATVNRHYAQLADASDREHVWKLCAQYGHDIAAP